MIGDLEKKQQQTEKTILKQQKKIDELKKLVKQMNQEELQRLEAVRNDIKSDIRSTKTSVDRTHNEIRDLAWGNFKLSTQEASIAYLNSIPAERYPEELCKWYYQKTGQILNLTNPQTSNDKIQWLKLYDATSLKTRLADKYLVRDWVKEKIGEEYLIPLLGVWDSFDEIDFDELPDRFVLKANHGSGWNIIVKDKSQFDREEAKKKFDVWMKTNYAFMYGLELQYLNIPPKIIAEQYMENLDQLYDYKVWCADGEPKFLWVDIDRYTEHKRIAYSMNWERLPLQIIESVPVDPRDHPKPECFQTMVWAAETMCKEFAQVRIDFYIVDNKLYFGEMTFTDGSGMLRNLPREFEYEMGSWITLPPKSPMPERQL